MDGSWLARVDHDVIVFVGESDFMREVIDRLGGDAAVRARMRDDFGVVESDGHGLRGYIESLLGSAASPEGE